MYQSLKVNQYQHKRYLQVKKFNSVGSNLKKKKPHVDQVCIKLLAYFKTYAVG